MSSKKAGRKINVR